MFEDFESYATGNIVPDCWARIIDTNGSQTITTTTPASGVRNIISTAQQLKIQQPLFFLSSAISMQEHIG
jgi:hypothetical protein